MPIAGINSQQPVRTVVDKYYQIARQRLNHQPEGEWPEIQAWRWAFSTMGLKPTQYRCASESLLRRFKTENTLLSIHPVIDLCNAVSMAHGIPIAVFDADLVNGYLRSKALVQSAKQTLIHTGWDTKWDDRWWSCTFRGGHACCRTREQSNDW
jgi:DNA/RNA-binding domain of Phe-tRNA-synthetase-like protein